MRKKKKKRRRGYHRGTYNSSIAGECKFRSSWEEKYMHYLDANPEVSSWSYEKLIIEYVSNKRTGKIRKYYPDFFVELKTGEKLVIEIKQKRKLDNVVVKKKSAAAEQWCMMHGASYKIITELDLKDMGLL